MTAQQYLLSQAEHCRRVAQGASDPFVAEELQRLADEFERKARGNDLRPVERMALVRSPERASAHF
jgi:hypothetical protein